MRKLAALLALFTFGCPRHALVGAPPTADIQLPRDHGAHLAQTEWWHFHGHLTDRRGRTFDFFLGFVRSHTDEDRFLFVPVRWGVDPGQLAVFSVTDRAGRRFVQREKYAYPDVWAASARAGRLGLRHDDWSADSSPDGIRLVASARGTELELLLGEGKPAVLEGRDGLFEVPPTAHLFYTLPRIAAAGYLTLDGERFEVSGLAWVKHQWGYLYSDRLAGWVWFGVQLDDGQELQIGLLRDADWQPVEGSFAEVIDSAGVAQRLELSKVGVVQTGEVWTSPRTGVTWPVGWRLELPERHGTLLLTTSVPEQELRPFPSPMWAGSLEVRGTLDGKAVKGQAMAEVFGLDQPFLRRFYTSGPPAKAGAP